MSRKRKFNPTEDCVVSENHSKKKAGNSSCTGRLKCIKVVCLRDSTLVIPRGRVRDLLSKQGMIRDVRVKRTMSASEVKCAIFNQFNLSENVELKYLRGHRGGALTISEEQVLDGVQLIDLAGSGSLYVQVKDVSFQESLSQPEQSDENDSASQFEFESSEGISQCFSTLEEVSAYCPILVSSDEEDGLMRNSLTDLNEFRQLREEQDEAYQQSLEIDRAKEEEKKKEQELSEIIESMKSTMKNKFGQCTDGFKLAFKLVSGEKIDCSLPHDATVKSKESLFSKPLSVEENEFEACRTIMNKSDCQRLEYLKSIAVQEGDVHIINRNNVYSDVLNLYSKDKIVEEYPISVSFCGEIAVDLGGVQRDMFAIFWNEAYSRLFEGSTLLTPMLHPQCDLGHFFTLGKVISHGFLVTGTLPIRVALPTLISILLGSSIMSSKAVLLDCFMEYISAVERNILQDAISFSKEKHFPSDLNNKLMSLLSRFGCRILPSPSNLISLIEQVAKYEFYTKPAAGIAMIHSGIPLEHKQFWNIHNPDSLTAIYKSLSLSPEKVTSLLSFPVCLSLQQSRISEYLRLMIENMQPKELSLFMRFVTGSSVCHTQSIHVEFNAVTGFGRAPFAHTCTSTLELSTSYLNYDDFVQDFTSIFSSVNEEFTWRMDAL